MNHAGGLDRNLSHRFGGTHGKGAEEVLGVSHPLKLSAAGPRQRRWLSGFLHHEAASALKLEGIDQSEDSTHRIFGADTGRMDIGNEVPLRIGVAISGTVGHVRRKAFRSRKARTLPDQQDHILRVEGLAYVVHDPNTAITNNERTTYRPTARQRVINERTE
jgi:hypothetical protein